MFFLAIFLISAVTFLISAYFFPGVAILQVEGLFVFCVLIGLVNSLVRPLKRLALQARVWKFGIPELLVNLLVVYLADKAIYGVEIYTPYAFVFIVLILTIVHLLINALTRRVRKEHLEAVPKSSEERRKEVLLLVETLAGIVFVVVVAVLFTPKAAISGKVIYNGVLPANAKDYTISVVQKEYKSDNEYAVAEENLPAATSNNWNWEDAQEGVTYQIQAVAVKGDHVAASSNIIEVTAPANGQLLIFNVTTQELEAGSANPNNPDNEAAESGTTEPTTSTEAGGDSPQVQNATVSGTLDLNGYIPEGSEVTVYRKASDQSEFVLAGKVPATDGLFRSWDSAVAGQAYTYYGVMHTKEGSEIGRSHMITIIAPSLNNILTINSTAEPPTPPAKVSISGQVKLNGVAPLNSSISMRQKRIGESTYQEFASIEAVDGVTWEYADAEETEQYNITAVLRVGSTDYREGQVLTVTAPASGELITIDTGIPPPTTPTCGINYNIRDDWGNGMTTDIIVRNQTSSSINTWELKWVFPGNQVITGMWNATYSQSGQNVTATSSLAIPPNNGSIQTGFNANYSGSNQKPTSFTLNGEQCELF